MKLGLLLVLCSLGAFAQEKQIGTILVNDAGCGSNINTGYGSAGCLSGDSCAQAFTIAPNMPITVQCNPPAVVEIGRATCDAGIGMELTASEKLFTLSGPAVTGITRPDGGTSSTSAVVCVSPTTGTISAICKVFTRKGVE